MVGDMGEGLSRLEMVGARLLDVGMGTMRKGCRFVLVVRNMMVSFSDSVGMGLGTWSSLTNPCTTETSLRGYGTGMGSISELTTHTMANGVGERSTATEQ
jgi:hypothetical protein